MVQVVHAMGFYDVWAHTISVLREQFLYTLRPPWYDYYLIAEATSLSEAHIFHSNGHESLPMTCYCTLIQFVVLWLVDNCLLADEAFSLLSLLLSVLSLSITQLLDTYDITSLQYIYGCIIRPPPAPLSTRRQWTVYN